MDERGLVDARPLVEYPPKVRDDRLVDVPAMRVNLHGGSAWTKRQSRDKMPRKRSGRLRTFSSVTFQSLIFVFGGSFVHVK